MSNYKFELPFEVERACRCSFVVRLQNGDRAYITNENLFYFMQHPYAQFDVFERLDCRHKVQKWIRVAQVVWTFGFKTRLFDCDGKAL